MPGHNPAKRGCGVSATVPKRANASGKKAFPAASELDAAARNRLLMDHLPQVRYIARRIRERLPACVQLEDLVHAGVLGLMEALRRYDPNRHVEFKSFARHRIQGAILDSLRELDWAPRTLRKRGRELERAHQALRNRLGRPPTEAELAAELRMELKKFQRLVDNLSGANLHSLQQEMGAEELRQEENRSDFLIAQMDDPFTICLSGEISRLLARAIADLPPRERRVLGLYYYEEQTMKEVARMLGVCEARVSQIHSAALAPLRSRLGELLASKHAPPHAGACQPPECDPRAAFVQTAVVCEEPRDGRWVATPSGAPQTIGASAGA
jgi:RNA polymerase sigma factor for flagellar operon FliA